MVLEEIQRLLWSRDTQWEEAAWESRSDIAPGPPLLPADSIPAWMREQQANNQRLGLGSNEPEEDRDELAEEASVSGNATDRRSWPQWMRRQRRANRRLRLRDDAYGLTVFLAENSETSCGSESSDAGEIGHDVLEVGLVEVRPPERCFADEPALSLEDSFSALDALDECCTPALKVDDHDQGLKSHPPSDSLVMSHDCQGPGAGNIEGRRRRYGLPRMPSQASTFASESDWAPTEKDVSTTLQVPALRDASTTLRVPAPRGRRLPGSFQRSGPMAAEDEF